MSFRAGIYNQWNGSENVWSLNTIAQESPQFIGTAEIRIII